jgi:hydrogenase maturation protease
MTQPDILVAGIGNIFLGDDGFGVEVIRRLAEHEQPQGVTLVDFGIRGLDLAFALLEGFDLAIMVDAMPRGGPPGKLYLLEPDLENLGQADIQAHNMDPVKVLQMVKAFGEALPQGQMRIVGCEPGTFGPEGIGRMGLSDPVAAAVDEAMHVVDRLIQSYREEKAALVK